MIRTNHPAILVATLVVLVVAVIALDPGLAALFGWAARQPRRPRPSRTGTSGR